MAWGGPSQSVLTLWSMHGEDLVSLYSHCGRWHGEDLVVHSHTVVGNVVHTPTVVDDAWRGPSQSTLTLQSMHGEALPNASTHLVSPFTPTAVDGMGRTSLVRTPAAVDGMGSS